MSFPILAGIETEYGLTVENRDISDQIDDSMALVRAFSDGCFVGWDYRFENPRADLRGFQVSSLAFDPEDAEHDRGKVRVGDRELRSDRILPNGARFYNDHGHPEYSTPESWSLDNLMLHDLAGERVVAEAARLFSASSGKSVKVYKNNTDFHGASYGTHENYLAPRSLGYERLFRALLPVLVCRQVLTGAGKAGFEHGTPCEYQMSQRADFFVEPSNVETLFRRPIFNTRDEPHADANDWIRVHVIAGDANRIPSCTRRKVGLIKLALIVEQAQECPVWRIHEPVRTLAELSRCYDREGRIELEGKSWTTPQLILESYLDAAEPLVKDDPELTTLISECRHLLAIRFSDPVAFAHQVDWAAKYRVLYTAAEEGIEWGSPEMQAYDLAYHDVDPETSLYQGLVAMDWAEGLPLDADLDNYLGQPQEETRAMARGISVQKFGAQLVNASWGTLTFRVKDGEKTVSLPPDKVYPRALGGVETVEALIAALETL